MSGSTTTVMGCTVVATGLTVIRNVKESKNIVKPITGGFVIGIFLLTVGMFSDDVARAFAFLMLATAIVTNGAIVFGITNKLIG